MNPNPPIPLINNPILLTHKGTTLPSSVTSSVKISNVNKAPLTLSAISEIFPLDLILVPATNGLKTSVVYSPCNNIIALNYGNPGHEVKTSNGFI